MKSAQILTVVFSLTVLFAAGCAGTAEPAGSAVPEEKEQPQPAAEKALPTLDEALVSAVQYFSTKAGDIRVLGLGNFHYADKKIGSQFSQYLDEKVSKALHEGNFEIFEKDKLEQIMEALRLSLSGLTDPDTMLDPGKLKGLQGLVSGRFLADGEKLIIFLELTDLETGTQLAKYELEAARNSIPASVSILPENYNDAVAVMEELKEVFNADNKDFVVRMWNPRGDGAIFRDGEEYVINFFSNRDCFIKIYHIDVNNTATLVFPNQFYANNFIKAGSLYQIPDAKYPFRFKLKEPFGTEIVKCIASTVQFDDIEQSFTPLTQKEETFRVRGWATVPVAEQITEAIMSYTIIP